MGAGGIIHGFTSPPPPRPQPRELEGVLQLLGVSQREHEATLRAAVGTVLPAGSSDEERDSAWDALQEDIQRRLGLQARGQGVADACVCVYVVCGEGGR